MMKSLWKPLSIVACALLMSAAFCPTASAQDWNSKLFITTSQPMEIPGNVILPAGDYTLQRLDLPSQHIVEFFSRDHKTLYNTVFTIPEYRLDPANESTVTFYEHAAGTVPAIRSWVMEGSTVGLQFLYPRARARQLAMVTGTTVPSSDTAVTPASEESNLDTVPNSQSDSSSLQLDNGSATQAVADATPSQSADVTPSQSDESTAPDMNTDASPAEGPDASAEQEATPQTTPAPAANDSSSTPALPKTAGAQDLLLLLGMASTAGAFVIRKFRR